MNDDVFVEYLDPSATGRLQGRNMVPAIRGHGENCGEPDAERCCCGRQKCEPESACHPDPFRHDFVMTRLRSENGLVLRRKGVFESRRGPRWRI